MKKIILIMLAGLVLGGCASTGPRFNPAELEVRPDMATVYFYRPSSMNCVFCDFPIIANGKEVANLSNSEQVKRFMRPGLYKFHSRKPGLMIDRRRDVILDAGKITYLRGTFHNRFVYGETFITEVDEAQAIDEISEL